MFAKGRARRHRHPRQRAHELTPIASDHRVSDDSQQHPNPSAATPSPEFLLRSAYVESAQMRGRSGGGAAGCSSPQQTATNLKTGTIVINPQFDLAYSFSDGLAAVLGDYRTGTWGFIAR